MEQRVSSLANSLYVHCRACGARCCRTGRILLQAEDEPRFSKKTTMKNGLAMIDLSNGCEHLLGGRCAIYEERPAICASFPLFLRYKTLFVAEACPAVREGVLDRELALLQKDFPGLRIVRQ